jgi:alpha-galactosidase
MSRTTGDIACRVTPGKTAIFSEDERGEIPEYVFSVLGIADITNRYAKYAGPGYWNDPDMLVTGDHGLSIDEQYSHFALWCIMSSPLFLGNDPRIMSEEEKRIIRNKEAIAINQDNTGEGRKIQNLSGVDIWKKDLHGDSKALLFVNRSSDQTINLTIDLNEFGISSIYSVYDVFEKDNYENPGHDVDISLRPHACTFIKVN